MFPYKDFSRFIPFGLRKAASGFWSKSTVRLLLIAFAVGIIQTAVFFLPSLDWLPSPRDVNSLLTTMWQVHASVLGVTVVVVTIVVTVIANEKDRARTWNLYENHAWFLPIVWFNLLAILSEGVASLQTYQVARPLLASDKVGNLILSEGLLFVLSILAAAKLFSVTLRFLNDDYIETLAEKQIMRSMPQALDEDLNRRQRLIESLQNVGGTRGR